MYVWCYLKQDEVSPASTEWIIHKYHRRTHTHTDGHTHRVTSWASCRSQKQIFPKSPNLAHIFIACLKISLFRLLRAFWTYLQDQKDSFMKLGMTQEAIDITNRHQISTWEVLGSSLGLGRCYENPNFQDWGVRGEMWDDVVTWAALVWVRE